VSAEGTGTTFRFALGVASPARSSRAAVRAGGAAAG
jgi:hypothetical protein